MYSDSDQEFEEVKVSRTLDEDCDVTGSRVRVRKATDYTLDLSSAGDVLVKDPFSQQEKTNEETHKLLRGFFAEYTRKSRELQATNKLCATYGFVVGYSRRKRYSRWYNIDHTLNGVRKQLVYHPPHKQRQFAIETSVNRLLPVLKDRAITVDAPPASALFARPNEPSICATFQCALVVEKRKIELLNEGRFLAIWPAYTYSVEQTFANPTLMPRSDITREEKRKRLRLSFQIAHTRSRSVEMTEFEPLWLVCEPQTQLSAGRLLALAMRCNAVLASIHQKRATQAASQQTTRLCTHVPTICAAQQTVDVQLAIALAKRIVLDRNKTPVGHNAFDSAFLPELVNCTRHAEVFPILAGVRTVFLNQKDRLGNSGVISVARYLANYHFETNSLPVAVDCALSDRGNACLLDLCASVLKRKAAGIDHKLDTAWSAVALIKFATLTQVGREFCRLNTQLTNCDLALVEVLTVYCRAELVRRNRLENEQTQAAAGNRLVDEPNARSNRDLATGASAHFLIIWFHNALTNVHSMAIRTLLAESPEAAKKGAEALVNLRAKVNDNVAKSIELKEAMMCNAEVSAVLMSKVVHRRKVDIPTFLRDKHDAVYVDQLQEDDEEALHAARFSPERLQPDKATGVVFVHSVIAGRMYCTKRTAAMEEMRAKYDTGVHISDVELPGHAGTTLLARSFLSLRAFAQVTAGLDRASQDFAKRWETADNTPERVEAYSRVAQPVAQGLVAQETSKFVFLKLRKRKSDSARVTLGVLSEHEHTRVNIEDEGQSEVPPMVNITSVEYNIPSQTAEEAYPPLEEEECVFQGGEPARLTTEPFREVKCTIGLQLSVHKPVRVPEMIRNVLNQQCADDGQFVRYYRSILFVAVSQASLCCDMEVMQGAALLLTSVTNSRRVSVADTNRALMLTPYDVLYAQNACLGHSYTDTPYEGVYRGGIDHGISSIGLGASNMRGDSRLHGSLVLSQQLSDELSTKFAEHHWVEKDLQIDDDGRTAKAFVATPPSVRGIPHLVVPRLHSVLNTYDKCMDLVDDALQSEEDKKKHPMEQERYFYRSNLQCMPFSCFSQALPPVVSQNYDATSIFCDDAEHIDPELSCAQSTLPGCTAGDIALFREPLMTRSFTVKNSIAFFSSSVFYFQPFWNSLNALALQSTIFSARWPDLKIGSVYDLFCLAKCALVGKRVVSQPVQLALMDAALLAATLYPHRINNAQPVLNPHVATASASIASGKTMEELSDQTRQGLLEFLRLFLSNRAQELLHPLLNRLRSLDGTHDVSATQKREMKRLVDDACMFARRAAHHNRIEDQFPSRLEHAFIGRPFTDEAAPQRAAFFGLFEHALRQVCFLAIASERGTADSVQVFRNEGAVSVRTSALVDAAVPRSQKSTSALQLDSPDEFSSGNYRLLQSDEQKVAYQRNIVLCFPSFLDIEPPASPLNLSTAHRLVACEMQESVQVRYNKRVVGTDVGELKRNHRVMAMLGETGKEVVAESRRRGGAKE